MNDDFLTQYRKTPPLEFADALYQRISQQVRPGFAFTIWNKLTLRNAGALLVFIVAVAACAYYAASRTPYHKVGGIWLTVQKTYVWEIPSVSETPEEITVPECPIVPLDEAREILQFDFLVPTWAPEGFTINDSVAISPSFSSGCDVSSTSDFISWSWTGNNGNSYIGIFIQNLRWYDPVANIYRLGEAAVWTPVAPGSYEEIEVNGQPSILIRGDWASPVMFTEPLPAGKIEFEWDKDLGLRLYWVQGEALYELYTYMFLQERHDLTIADVSPEDLIKMAESAR